ncbi:MAG: UvrD-helicase domain-containing protein [Dehalococcoidales bacterium]|nr:UvrD-helicase domain-containing protein [Dehalococcoidales bacterium]
MDVLAELNPAQREAVEAISGPILILAGPGSGKTRVITHRVAYLITVCGINPRRIMAVTFTNKAAREMSDRLHNLVSGSAGELTLGTFHAICARILRQDGRALDINPRYVIYDASDQQSLLKRAMLAIGIDPKQYSPQAVATAISWAKSHLLTPADYVRRGRSYFEEIVSRCYERYQQLLTESNALDFDDLLMKTVQLFRKSPETLSRYQSRYLHLLVDEFQDTNLVQYELVKQLGAKHRNICVVGDPDQSIYSWRSADLRNILSFENDYPDAKLVLLEQNYRSTRTILDTASSVISANELRKPKNLWTDNEAGELTRIVETYTEQDEAQFVVNEIERLVDLREAKLGDCAVMYRTNAQSRVIEEAFVRYGTPYKLVAGTRFYERREVKDVIAYLRLVHNPQDTVSLMRVINVPGRGIGQQTLTRLSDRARSLGISPSEALRLIAEASEKDDVPEHPFSPRTTRLLADFWMMLEGFITKSRELDLVELFDTVVESSGYQRYIMSGDDGEERWDNILELRGVAQEYRHLKSTEGLIAFLEGVALVSDIDSLDETTDRVTLITLHQAKGLEFPVVFIVGMEERLLPHVRSFDDAAQMEEERRLCYVGITRAKQRLYLVRSFRRTLMGSSNVNKPSRFLEDIPGHLTSTPGWWQEGTDKVAEAVYSWGPASTSEQTSGANKPASNGAMSDLKAGDHVSHTQFGEGVVVSCKKVRDDSEVVVAFIDQGVKRLLSSLASLKKVS